jgi:hypothetical protein
MLKLFKKPPTLRPVIESVGQLKSFSGRTRAKRVPYDIEMGWTAAW